MVQVLGILVPAILYCPYYHPPTLITAEGGALKDKILDCLMGREENRHIATTTATHPGGWVGASVCTVAVYSALKKLPSRPRLKRL